MKYIYTMLKHKDYFILERLVPQKKEREKQTKQTNFYLLEHINMYFKKTYIAKRKFQKLLFLFFKRLKTYFYDVTLNAQ